MARKIVVMSNCQTGGLHAALAAMLPADHVSSLAWLGTEPPGLRAELVGADVWVCSIPRAQAEAIAGEAGLSPQIIVVPTIWFPAFHPDQTPILWRRGGELEGAVGPYHSKICVWGWTHGFDADAVLAWFRPEVFAALFGLPPEDRDRLARWGNAVIAAFPPPPTPEQVVAVEVGPGSLGEPPGREGDGRHGQIRVSGDPRSIRRCVDRSDRDQLL